MKKTLSFTVMHFTIAFGVAWLLTGDIIIGGLVALVEPAVNSIAYYFHEKIWTCASPPASEGTIAKQKAVIPA